MQQIGADDEHSKAPTHGCQQIMCVNVFRNSIPRSLHHLFVFPPRRIGYVGGGIFCLYLPHQPERPAPSVQIAVVIALTEMFQGCLSRPGHAVRGEQLPQAQLVGGQFFIAIDAEGVAQDRTILCAERSE